jgi:hypothetical protein
MYCKMDKPQKICYEDEECCAIYRLSQKLRTNGPLRCRRDYRKNVKKIQLDLFSDLAVFESGPKQVNYFAIYSDGTKVSNIGCNFLI